MLRVEKVRDVIKSFGPKIMKTKRSSQKSFFFYMQTRSLSVILY